MLLEETSLAGEADSQIEAAISRVAMSWCSISAAIEPAMPSIFGDHPLHRVDDGLCQVLNLGDQARDIIRRCCGLSGRRLDLDGDDREAATRLAGRRGLDRCVQGQQAMPPMRPLTSAIIATAADRV